MRRILVVEDCPLFRRGFTEILIEQVEDVSIGEASTVQMALALIRNEPWDTVVLGIHLPGKIGVELLHDIKQHTPALPVLVLGTHPDESYAIHMLKAGASGYLRKTADPSEVIEAVAKVLEGGTYVTRSISGQLVLALQSTETKLPHECLSKREFQVLRHVVEGKGPTKIAQELDVSVTTISTYRGRILKKMNMNSNADLIRYAIEHEILR